jgi:hypothetical protein
MGDFSGVYLVRGDIKAYGIIPGIGAAGLALWNLGHQYLQ